MSTKHRLIALRFADDLPEDEPLVMIPHATFDQAREALKPFAELGVYLQGNEFNELFSTGGLRISMEDLKKAAKVLAAMEDAGR